MNNKTERASTLLKTLPAQDQIVEARATLKFLLAEMESGKLTGLAGNAYKSIAEKAIAKLGNALSELKSL